MVRARSLVLVLLMLASAAHAGRFELLSQAGMESDTAEGRWEAPFGIHLELQPPAVSADGRWVAFVSVARNLVPGQQDAGSGRQAFLHDRQTGTTVLVSHAAGSATAPGNARAGRVSISADGRWVVYESQADNLVPGQTASAHEQVFLFDRDTGTNTLVSRSSAGSAVASNGAASDSTISADGEWIAFASTADNLLPGQVDPDGIDVFLFERATGQTILVSRAHGTTTTAGNFGSWQPSLSADGRYVAFSSDATDLIAGFGGSLGNVFLFDRVSGSMTLVSHASSSTTNGATGIGPAISPDGAAVAFYSAGTSLVAGQVDTNGGNDVFLFDRLTGGNVLVSRSAASPTTTGDREVSTSAVLRVTGGGADVAFASFATNAVAGQNDSNGPFAGTGADVFLFERATSSLTLVSRSTASATATANRESTVSALAEDGSFVVFETAATDVVAGQTDANEATDVFLFDRAAGTSVLVSGAGGSGQVTGGSRSLFTDLSADGSAIAFWSLADDLVAGDFNSDPDVIVYDRSAGTLSAATLQAPGMPSSTPGASSIVTSVSADGRYDVLLSLGLNVVAGQADGNRGTDVFLVDRVAGTTTLVSRSAGSATTAGDQPSDSAAISADGAFVAFSSRATDLVPGQVDSAPAGPDVFLYDRSAGTTTLVSHAAGSLTVTGDLPCDVVPPAISADGRHVAFQCSASDLVTGQTDANSSMADVFLYDRVSGETILVSRKASSATTTGNGGSTSPAISADGRYIAFASDALDLISGGDGNGTSDVFLFDQVAGQMLLVSRQAGTPATAANASSSRPSLTPDGRHVAFASEATDLVAGQVDPPDPFLLKDDDVFLFDRVTGVVELISRSNGSATNAANYESNEPALSDDGRYVAFLSRATDLIPGQSHPGDHLTLDVFVHDRVLRTMELISRSAVSPNIAGDDDSGRPALSPDGRRVAFYSSASNLAPDPLDSFFLFDRQSRTLEQVARSPFFPVLRPLLSADGSVAFLSTTFPGLTAGDLNGEHDAFAYVPDAPVTGDFFTLPPCRLIDTRQAGQGPALTAGVPRAVSTRGVCGIPATARAVALNVTVLQAQGDGRLTLYPGNLSTPATSTINFQSGQTLANNAILALASNGEGTLGITPFVIGGGTVHVLVDVSGWFE